MSLRSRRQKRQVKQWLPDLNLTPLIDTALTLVIIFMVTTPILKKENALQVELPKGNVKEVSDTNKQEIIIAVEKDGKLYLNAQQVKQSELFKQLKTLVNPKAQKTVFVKADTSVQYGKVIELVDSIKQVEGVKYVALATAKVQPKA